MGDFVRQSEHVKGGTEAAETATAPDQTRVAGGNEGMADPKSSRSPAFQFYPKDFLSSSKVQRMSLSERGAYITLLSFCWLDGSIPTDSKEIARMVGIPSAHFSKLWSGPLQQCFTEKNGRLINDRLEDERKKQALYRKQQADRAGKGWAKRKLHTSGNATALQTPHADGNASLLQSSSAVSSLQTASKTSPAPRGAPIVTKRNGNAAWEGSRGLYVVQGQHQKFAALLNREDADRVLFGWYSDVAAEWTDGARKDENPGLDMVAFWAARHAERWPASAAPAVNDKRPEWLKQAEARKRAGAAS